MSAAPTSDSSNGSNGSPRRGAFILLEGLDRSGKSSQCVKLAETLNAEQKDSALQLRFPGELHCSRLSAVHVFARELWMLTL